MLKVLVRLTFVLALVLATSAVLWRDDAKIFAGAAGGKGPASQAAGMAPAAEVGFAGGGGASPGFSPEPGSPRLVGGGSNSLQVVCRMVLEDGRCRLEAIEEVRGDFRPRRGAADVQAGMIGCRLVDAAGQVLAEEFVHAPDHVCAVLDPNTDPIEPQVAVLAGAGAQVFQVRFPAALAGEKLEVYRITQTHPELARTLLLTAPLQR